LQTANQGGVELETAVDLFHHYGQLIKFGAFSYPDCAVWVYVV
jgi:hypothetical protein